MASLFGKVAKFASSPQGKQALDKAKKAASDPKNKEKVNDLLGKAKGAVGGDKKKDGPQPPPAGQAPPPPAAP